MFEVNSLHISVNKLSKILKKNRTQLRRDIDSGKLKTVEVRGKFGKEQAVFEEGLATYLGKDPARLIFDVIWANSHFDEMDDVRDEAAAGWFDKQPEQPWEKDVIPMAAKVNMAIDARLTGINRDLPTLLRVTKEETLRVFPS